MENNPFLKMLVEMRYGTLLDDLAEKSQQVANACYETGKQGSIQLTITMKPGKAGEVELSDKIVAKIPEHTPATSIMYITPQGNLQRHDPRQIDIADLKEIAAKKSTELKEV